MSAEVVSDGGAHGSLEHVPGGAPGTRSLAPHPRPHVLREYALVADGERGILVGPSGDFAWMCFPGWAGEGLFSSLVGGKGTYVVAPRDRFVWGGWYEPGSLIWRSRWVTERDAVVECREALALPAAPDRAVILRRVLAQRGSVRLGIALDPRTGYGVQPLRHVRQRDDGAWEGRTGSVHVAWWGAEDAHAKSDHDGSTALTLELELDEGEAHDLLLVVSLGECGERYDLDRLWASTEAGWQERVPDLSLGRTGRDARHACAVLHGLTSTTGGMVAAATMSLPERANRDRSFDYRYVWIRDQAYAGRAAARAGVAPLLDAAVSFTRDRLLERGTGLEPAYTAAGDPVPEERRLDLPGYPGGTGLVGNRVRSQFQLDVFGEALLLFAAAAEHDRIDATVWSAAEIAARAVENRWQEPDAGIWELGPDRWTQSRLGAAAGLRAICGHGPDTARTARWLALADAIVADVASTGVHPSGRWQRSPTDERVDAALLLPALRGAVPADDPRSVATLEAVLAELTEDGYAYRYRPDARPLGEAEGAFLLCGFLVALALEQQGRDVAAARWFERNRAACGPPGLLSEEYDVRQRQMRGNLPQAFVHALLLETAVALDEADAAPDGAGR